MKVQNAVVTFKKTDDEFGGFSNMSGDFPIMVNGVRVRSSEHLYQALKFTDHPDVQRAILDEPSPMKAKWIAKTKDDVKKNKKGNLKKVRKDWEEIQLEVMAFCLKTKLIWYWIKFGQLLRSTEGKEIFEIETREVTSPFWGVFPDGDGFRGENRLGELLMKLRDELIDSDNESLMVVEAPPHLGLKFLGEEIGLIDRRNHLVKGGTRFSERVAEVRP
jgi:ribA/ribD-fused uncharacterized protein